MAVDKLKGAESTELSKKYDIILLIPAIIALGSMFVVGFSDKHVLPQTSATFFLKPIRDFDPVLGVKTESHAVYDLSKWKTEYGIHATAALKYSRGCYGPKILSHLKEYKTRNPNNDLSYYLALSTAQRNNSGFEPESICTCIDDHTKQAWPKTTQLGYELAERLNQTMSTYTIGENGNGTGGGTHTHESMTDMHAFMMKVGLTPHPDHHASAQIYAQAYSMGGGDERLLLPTTYANFKYDLTTEAQFKTLNEIGSWCDKTAAPQYTLEFASVINSKLLMLVGLSFMFLGLDITGQRNRTGQSEHSILTLVIDILPLLYFSWSFLNFQWKNHIQYIDDLGGKNDGSYLMVLICLMIFIGGLITVVLGCVFVRKQDSISHVLERIYHDLPMIVGLSLLGVGLKLQNAEHDETILITTLFLLVGAGLLQHLSSVVKTLYDRICCGLSDDVINQLQAGKKNDELKLEDDNLKTTRHILQYFGWTRLYAFFVVVLFAVFSYTISSSVNTFNPLATYTQNQYFYFMFIFVTALAGLDFAYEILPFTQEDDEKDGMVAMERLRKIAVLVYIIFTLLSQVAIERQEL